MEFLQSLPWLTIHITAVFCTLAVVVISDAHGVWWLLGRIDTLPARRLHRLHQLVWIGLAIIMSAGFMMFIDYPDYLLEQPAFRLKLLFVATLVANAVFITKHLTIATRVPFASLSSREKSVLLVSGAVSTLGWIGALVAAQFLS